VDILQSFLPPVLLITFTTVMLIFINRGRKRISREQREIAAYNRLRRMLGLAVEAGTRLHVSIGRGILADLQGAAAFVGVAMLERVARAASISDQPPIATSGDGLLSILSTNTLRSTYNDIGLDGQFNPDASQITGVTPFSYTVGAMSVLGSEGISASLLAGSFGGEVVLLADSAERNGSVTIGGSENLTAQAVLYAAAHEPLVGEELFAANAYLVADGTQAASLKAEDVIRWVLIAVLALVALLKLTGIL
jgi:hypothetical protein